MTVREYTELLCDQPKCRKRWPSGPNPSPCGWQYARKRAAEQGWLCDRMKGDFCPIHAADADSGPREER